MYWTPHNDGYVKTTGNTTFKLIWGNGPGNAGYMMIPNPFLYVTNSHPSTLYLVNSKGH